MVKVVVLYGHPTDPAAFDEYYQQKHIPIAQKIPDVRRFEAELIEYFSSRHADIVEHLHRPLVEDVRLGQVRRLRPRADQQVLDSKPGQQHRRGQTRSSAAHDQDRDVLVHPLGNSHVRSPDWKLERTLQDKF